MYRNTVCSFLALLVVSVAVPWRSASAALVAHWKFDETSGIVARDSGPNKINGTLNGNPQWVPGKIGGALEFDGDGDYVNCGNAAPLNLRNEITIACWIKIASFTRNWETILGKGDNSYRMSRSSTTGNSVHFGLNGTTGGNLNASRVITDDTWHHVALVYNLSYKVIYIDGVENARVASTGQINQSTYNLYIGANSQQANRQLKGVVDDVRIYDRAMSAQQVTALVTDGIDPSWLKAWSPSPAHGATGVIDPLLLGWSKGETAIFHEVWFGTDPAALAKVSPPYYTATVYIHPQPLTPGVTYYWRVDEVEPDLVTIHTGDLWGFFVRPLPAWGPSPADKATSVFPAQTLRWSAGQQAIKHHLYFGTSLAEVQDAAAAADRGILLDLSYVLPLLRASTTYYWRVDEIKPGDVVEPGSIWSFTTTEAVRTKVVRQWWLGITGTAVSALTGDPNYPNHPAGRELLDLFEGPSAWNNNYGSRLYGWLIPPETGDYTFWIASDDYSELRLSTDMDPANAAVIATVPGYTSSRQWDKFPTDQKSAAIHLQAGQKYYLEALMKEGTGGDNIAVSWQGGSITAQEVISARYVDTFALPPLQAYAPDPADGAVEVIQAPTLTWGAGDKAVSHEVYLGDDPNAVAAADTASPLFQGSQADAGFEAGELEWDKTYYWRVDEVNPAEADSPWKGNVWSFTTRDYLLIDDFESYDDNVEAQTTIYDAWVDGLADKRSTSQVGYWDPPFCEQTIVHGGNQSMPLDYNNLNSPYFAEVKLEFAPVQNWTVNGLTDLSLWVHGRPAGFLELEGGGVNMSGAGTDIWGTADEFRYAFKILNGDGTLIALVAGRGPGSNAWSKGGVMIRDGLEPGSTHAMMVITGGNGNGYAFQRRLVADNASTGNSGVAPAIAPPYWVKIERKGDDFTGSVSPDGVTWTQVGATQTIVMTPPVYIGLAVTSHAPGELRGYQFENIAATGDVTGDWTVQDIGVPQGNGNGLDPLYVVVEETPTRIAIVKHPDPYAVLALGWTEWRIPLSSLTGINRAKVKSLYLGVGDRKATVPTGAGLIYIDDIRVVRPAPAPQ